MTLRKTGTCEACGATLYGDEHRPVVHNCPALVTAKDALTALEYIEFSGRVRIDVCANIVRKYIQQTIERGEGD